MRPNTIYFSDLVKTEHGAKAPQNAQWVLMTKDVIPGSRRQSYADQQRLVQEKPQYEVPDLLSATVGILAHYVRTGERLFSREPFTYTRCRETVGRYKTVVGYFAPAGLNLNDSHYDSAHYVVGVAALRKYPTEHPLRPHRGLQKTQRPPPECKVA